MFFIFISANHRQIHAYADELWAHSQKKDLVHRIMESVKFPNSRA